MISSQQSLVYKLKNNVNSSLDEYCVITGVNDMIELKSYIKEIVEDPTELGSLQAQKILLMYIAVIQFVIISFDPDQYLDRELVNGCDELARKLYQLYKDMNTLLYIRQIEHLWKTYVKLCIIAKKVPSESSHKITRSRNRLLHDIRIVHNRVKCIYNPIY